jgi:hypothetical protein
MTAGAGATGTTCPGGDTDCAAGLTCVFGVCSPFCTASQLGTKCTGSSAGAPLGQCIQLTNSGTVIPQDTICLFECAADPNSCPPGQGCIGVTVESGTTYSECQLAGTSGPGVSCTSDANCVAGDVCVASADVCGQVCRSNADCANLGNTCDLSAPVTVNGVAYGVCD